MPLPYRSPFVSASLGLKSKWVSRFAQCLVSVLLLASATESYAGFTQQGAKLTGSGYSYFAPQQGWAVAISADGNTAAVGGYQDGANYADGSVWVFVRSGTTWSQQAQLQGTGAILDISMSITAQLGYSLAISADGNTILAGGIGDNNAQGAVWAFVRNGTTWSQQGSKMVLTPNSGQGTNVGYSMAISADGNTGAVGVRSCDPINGQGPVGATFIITRSGSTWSQQAKLLGTGAAFPAAQGNGVALSSDGNTLAVGGDADGSGTVADGAVWVFTRSGTTWTQQGTKLVGTTSSSAGAALGTSVALSSDGNTLLAGGFYDSNHAGAAWVFTRSGSTWTQQGSKLLPAGVSGQAYVGTFVSLSGDGNTAVLGGPQDGATNDGAVWVYTRSGTTWTQQGSKFSGSGATPGAHVGQSVALSTDGSTLIIGGPDDNTVGGAWIFTQPVAVAPTITSISTSSGPTAGGTSVTITGTNLSGATGVKFGTTSATGLTANTATSITVTAPAGSAGTVDVTVTTAGGTSATGAGDRFTYVAAPTVATTAATNLTANGADLNGTVNANGASTTATFEYGLTTAYGSSVAATPGTVTGSSSTAVTTTLSGLIPGATYHFRAKGTSTGGTTSGTDQTFTIAAAATVSVLGTAAQINNNATLTSYSVPAGTNRLLIVAASAASASVSSSITGVTFNGQAMIAGVSNADGASRGFDSFWYLKLGTSASANTGNIVATATGGAITSLGAIAFQNVDQSTPTNKAGLQNSISSGNDTRSFASGINVGDLVYDLFDIVDNTTTGTRTPSTGQTVANSVDAPSGSLFRYYVTGLRNGTSGTNSIGWTSSGQAFNHVMMNIRQAPPAPTVTGISPTNGSTLGGTSVTLTGTGFTGATGVTIGGAAATGLSVTNDTTLSCLTPAGAAGTASVVVTAPGGTNTPNTLYTYVVPTVNSAPSFILPDGTTWTARENTRFWSAITSSADGTKLAAVVNGGLIYTSTDSGATWTPRDSSRSWFSITSSSDGTKLAAVVQNGLIYTSTDSGATWTPRDSSRGWQSITSSADGTKLAAVVYAGQIYTSADSGATWTPQESSRAWYSIASSADGTKLAAVVQDDLIYTSTNSGATWTAQASGVHSWQAITSSADGTKLAAIDYIGPSFAGGQIYTSTDSGVTWTPRESNRFWTFITSSTDGTKLAAVVNPGQIYTSTDSGATWTPRASSRHWNAIATSADGIKLAAVVNNGQIYTTPNSAAPYNVSVIAGSGPVSTSAFATNISPGPAADAGQTVNFTVNNNNTGLFTTQPAIASNGTLTFTPSSSSGVATVTVTAVDNGGTANGGVNTSASQTFTITVLASAPTVTNITSSSANAAYNAGKVIPISVTFSAAVDVTGTPTLALNSGSSATYASGTGTSTLIFSYTVGATDNTALLDSFSTTALTGTISATTGGTAATLTLPTPGGANSLSVNKALVIDTTAPTITSIVRLTPTGQTIASNSVTFRVTYSEPVTGPGIANFAVVAVNGSNIVGTVTSVTGTGNTRDVAVTITSGTGEFRLRGVN